MTSVDIDYIISNVASTSALSTFAAGPDYCPLIFELYSGTTDLGQTHNLYTLSAYETTPSTYPLFRVGVNSDNTLASTTRIPITVLVKSKYNSA